MSISLEFQEFENELINLGIDNLSSTKLNYGKNSFAWKIKTKNCFYFLKHYKSKKGDNRDRVGSEKRFLTLLKHGNITNVPEIIHINEKKKWILLEWIEGEKLTNPTKEDWSMMIDFINKIQDLRISKFSSFIRNASESCFSIDDHFDLIETRLSSLIRKSRKLSDQDLIFNWLTGEVLPSIEKFKIRYKYILKNETFKAKIKKILSPSDVGFHNVLKRENKLYFHDFEYSGWDDAYKLLVDLLIHPDYVVELELANFIIDNLKNNFKIEKSDHILKIFIGLYRVKWICIIFNTLNSDKENNKSLYIKSHNYFNQIKNIWNL